MAKYLALSPLLTEVVLNGPQYKVTRDVPRLVEDPQGVFELAAAVTMVLSIPQQAAHGAEAVYVLPGQGEWWREAAAIQAWESYGCQARRLIVAGSYGHEETWVPPTLARYQEPPFHLTRTQGVVLHDHAHHTAEQAAQMVTDVRLERLTSLALHASPYHIVRAFMTFVAAFDKYGLDWIPIIPVPTPVSPQDIVPETGMTPWQLSPGEFARIAEFQAKGDVVSFVRLREYLEWLWRQPLLHQTFRA